MAVAAMLEQARAAAVAGDRETAERLALAAVSLAAPAPSLPARDPEAGEVAPVVQLDAERKRRRGT